MDTPDLASIPVLTTGNPDFFPIYMTAGAAGADLMAATTEPIILHPSSSLLIPTGIRVAIPEGFEIQIRPRSGLALKHQITVLNTPGTIDSDYRGQIQVILINHGKDPFMITPGMRIGQAVLAKVYKAEFIFCEDLDTTARNHGGFGHTNFSEKNSAPTHFST